MRRPRRRSEPAPPEPMGWGQPTGRPELPPDLAFLGAEIEAAATRRLIRARALRRTARHAACVLGIGVPLAVSTAAVDLAPASRPVGDVARMQVVWPESTSDLPARTLMARASSGRVCAQDPDCRVPDLPSPAPFPLRTYE